MKVLYEKFLENCTDPIASVRQGGACSLGYLVKANKEFLDPTIKEGINKYTQCTTKLRNNFQGIAQLKCTLIVYIPLKSLFVIVSKI